jgi:hypothetical protein
MAATLSTKTLRERYRQSSLDKLLRKVLIAEKVCTVDRGDNYKIHNPYSSQPTVTVQALTGTYSPANFSTIDDTLTVTDEFIVSEHIFDFEDVISDFNLFANRIDEQNFAVAAKIDSFVLNNLCADAAGAYTTPVGGFTTAANVNLIFSNLTSKVMGFADAYRGQYIILENTDMPGIIQAGATNGFNLADQVLNNGQVGRWMGVDIFVARTGTFTSETVGTKTWTNDGHRIFGVKGCATYAAPRGIQMREMEVSGKTGKELTTWGYIGFKLWATKNQSGSELTYDITLA